MRAEHLNYYRQRWVAYWSVDKMLRAEHPEWPEWKLVGAVADWLAEWARL